MKAVVPDAPYVPSWRVTGNELQRCRSRVFKRHFVPDEQPASAKAFGFCLPLAFGMIGG
jgi:hypothetical protein